MNCECCGKELSFVRLVVENKHYRDWKCYGLRYHRVVAKPDESKQESFFEKLLDNQPNKLPDLWQTIITDGCSERYSFSGRSWATTGSSSWKGNMTNKIGGYSLPPRTRVIPFVLRIAERNEKERRQRATKLDKKLPTKAIGNRGKDS